MLKRRLGFIWNAAGHRIPLASTCGTFFIWTIPTILREFNVNTSPMFGTVCIGVGTLVAPIIILFFVAKYGIELEDKLAVNVRLHLTTGHELLEDICRVKVMNHSQGTKATGLLVRLADIVDSTGNHIRPDVLPLGLATQQQHRQNQKHPERPTGRFDLDAGQHKFMNIGTPDDIRVIRFCFEDGSDDDLNISSGDFQIVLELSGAGPIQKYIYTVHKQGRVLGLTELTTPSTLHT